ncbi:hypothetical protein NQ317_014328 [Molorchus minor]|uniref:Uncharacterized protein n=1 Tax=Molorchus minor TaxID=1323400 RepID=A0ABQ9JXG0_9CUCU|nr:hypothetical protein NQ317_014328 [Molorchus minor]
MTCMIMRIISAFFLISTVCSLPQINKDTLGSARDTGKQCVCMNWRYCDGTINSDVPCPQSYIQVCCIQPDPEAINSNERNGVVRV